MKQTQWQAMYGSVPDSFERRVALTLRGIEEGKPVKRLTLRTVLITALILVLLAIVAYAAIAIPSIRDIYSEWYGQDNETTQLLGEQTAQAPNQTFELDDVTITLTEVIFDGNTLYSTGVVKAKEGRDIVLLPPPDYSPRDIAFVDTMRGEVAPDGAPSYAELAAQKNARLVYSNVWIEAEGGSGSYMNDAMPLSDGTYQFINEFDDVTVRDGRIAVTVEAMQYDVTDEHVRVEGTEDRQKWQISIPAIAEAIITPEPTDVPPTPMPAAMQSEALRVIGESENGWVGGPFREKWPQEPVLYVDNPLAEELVMSIGAEQWVDLPEWDVMSLHTTDDLKGLMAAGKLADLSGDLALMDEVNKMFPTIRDAVMHEGKLYAIPVFISGEFFSAGLLGSEVDGWTQYGLTEADLPGSFEQLCDFIVRWMQRPAEQRKGAILFPNGVRHTLLDPLLDQYVVAQAMSGQPLTFDTPEFRRLLAAMRTAADAAKVEKRGNVDFSLFHVTPSAIQNAPRVLPKRLTPDAPIRYDARMTVLVVNADSPRKDQAMRYVASAFDFIAQRSRNKAEFYEGLTSADLPGTPLEEVLAVQREEGESEEDLAKIAKTYQPEVIPDSELIAYQQNIAPYLVFPQHPVYRRTTEGWHAMNDLRNQYLAGDLDDAAFIVALNALVAQYADN